MHLAGSQALITCRSWMVGGSTIVRLGCCACCCTRKERGRAWVSMACGQQKLNTKNTFTVNSAQKGTGCCAVLVILPPGPANRLHSQVILAVADCLMQQQYTQPDVLAVRGRSADDLTAAAVLNLVQQQHLPAALQSFLEGLPYQCMPALQYRVGLKVAILPLQPCPVTFQLLV